MHLCAYLHSRNSNLAFSPLPVLLVPAASHPAAGNLNNFSNLMCAPLALTAKLQVRRTIASRFLRFRCLTRVALTRRKRNTEQPGHRKRSVPRAKRLVGFKFQSFHATLSSLLPSARCSSWRYISSETLFLAFLAALRFVYCSFHPEHVCFISSFHLYDARRSRERDR